LKRWDSRRLLKVFIVPDSRIVRGISFHTVEAACRKACRLKLVLRGGVCRGGLGERSRGEGRGRGNGKGRGKEEVGGIAPWWLVG